MRGGEELKDLITSMGSIMILMIFVLQFASNQSLSGRFAAADALIGDAVFNMGEEGELSAACEEQLKQKLSEIFNCSREQVVIEKEEGEAAFVEVPVKGVIACGDMLGIPDEENVTFYRKALGDVK